MVLHTLQEGNFKMEKKIKLTLTILILCAGLFDFFTFAQHKQFLKLEANFLFRLIGNIYIMFAVKFLILFFIIYMIYQCHKYTPFQQYFWIFMGVLIIIGQFVAGGVNIYAKQSVAEDMGYESPSQVTAEDMEKVTVTEKEYNYTVAIYSGVMLYFPLLLSLISFKLWELCFYNKNIWGEAKLLETSNIIPRTKVR